MIVIALTLSTALTTSNLVWVVAMSDKIGGYRVNASFIRVDHAYICKVVECISYPSINHKQNQHLI